VGLPFLCGDRKGGRPFARLHGEFLLRRQDGRGHAHHCAQWHPFEKYHFHLPSDSESEAQPCAFESSPVNGKMSTA